jgi:pilus assembly protein CpaF
VLGDRFGQKSVKGLQQRLAEARGEAEPQPQAPVFSRERFFADIRPKAQKLVQSRFGAEELADRHSPAVRARVQNVLLELVEQEASHLPKPSRINIAAELVDDLLGYGPLEKFFTGPEAEGVTEIKVLRWDVIRIEKEGREFAAQDENGRPLRFRDEQHLRDVLDRMLAPTGRRVDLSSPRVSARLPDGSRLMAHIPPVAVNGTTLSIRRFLTNLTMEEFIRRESLSEELAEFLGACVRGRLNLVVSGGTSSGKSSFLNVLATYIPEEESIVTIEDPAELELMHPNVRRLEARPANVEGQGEITQRDLVADALRMAPKRIIVGECRRGEAFDMMQAMGTGHDGSMTTAHANSADHMLNTRLPDMIMMANMGLPHEAILRMIADSVDLVVHLVKDRSGRRRVDHVCEVAGLADSAAGPVVATRTLYRFSPEKKTWLRTPEPFTKKEKLLDSGIELPQGVM